MKNDTFTFGIIELSNYLKEHKITTVAMEATGVYWIPIYEVLEKNGFEGILSKKGGRVICTYRIYIQNYFSILSGTL